MRIGSGLMGSDLSALNSLNRAFTQMKTAGLRLATMKRINTASDDPAGLIAAQQIRSEMEQLEQFDRNASRARGTLAVADSGLEQTGEVLSQIRGALSDIAGGGLSDAEVKAKQIEINAGLEAINRIGATTSFLGRKLLDGGAGFQTSGVNDAQVSDITVHQNNGAGSQTPEIEVTQAAQRAELTFSDDDGALDEDIKIQVSGEQGMVELSFSAGTSLDDVADAVNAATSATGVEASVDGNDLTLSSSEVGSDQSISVEALEGSFDVGGSNTATGSDVVVEVEGLEFTGEGNSVEVHTSSLQADITFAEGFSGMVDPITVSGGGLSFALGGDVSSLSTLALPNVNSAALGGESGRLSDLAAGGDLAATTGNVAQAMEVVDQASSQINEARARIGAFEKYTIDSQQQVNESIHQNLAESYSQIMDTDVAMEASNMIRAQILADAGIATMLMNNQRREAVGAILGFGGFSNFGRLRL